MWKRTVHKHNDVLITIKEPKLAYGVRLKSQLFRRPRQGYFNSEVQGQPRQLSKSLSQTNKQQQQQKCTIYSRIEATSVVQHLSTVRQGSGFHSFLHCHPAGGQMCVLSCTQARTHTHRGKQSTFQVHK